MAARVEVQFRDENLFNRGGQRVEGIGPFPGRCRRWIGILHLPTVPRVLLLRRLRFPFPFPGAVAGVAFHSDSSGHHRAVCARVGILGEGGFALESVAARICREAGGRVTTNVMVRDLDLAAPNIFDARRLEAFLSCQVSCGHHHGQ